MTNNLRLARMILRNMFVTSALLASLGTMSIQASAQHVAQAAPETNTLLVQARTLVAQGKLAEAQILLNQAHDLSPERVDVLTLLGKVDGRLGDYPQAVQVFHHVV